MKRDRPVSAVMGILVMLAMFAWAAMGALNTQRLHTNTWTSYTVQPGDTLFSLWQRYDVTDDRWVVIDEIENRNGLGNSSTIRPGEVLEIPDGEK